MEGMIDKQLLNKQPEQKPVVFASDTDIDAVLSEMDETKQPFNRPEIPEGTEEIFQTEEKVVNESQKRRSNQTARFFVETFDNTLAVGFSAWSLSGNPKEFAADPEDIDEMAQYWGIYFADKNIDLPPWAMALIVTSIVIGKKFTHASHIRKLNLELADERKEKKALKDENEKLKREKELEDLRQENEKLKGK